MSASANPVIKAAQTEPVRLAGLISGLAVFLIVRYGHVDASLAEQIAGLAVPLVLAELARMHVVPAVKAGDAQTALTSIGQLQQQVATLEALGRGNASVAAIADALHGALTDAAGVLQEGFDGSLAAQREALAPHVAALTRVAESVASLQGAQAAARSPVPDLDALRGAPEVASPAVTVNLPTAGSPQNEPVGTRDAGAEVPAPVASAPASPSSHTAPPTLKG